MTRTSINRALSRVYWLLFIILSFLLASRFADYIPGLPPVVLNIAERFYEFMRDMSLLIATGGVAYLSNLFQKRSKFVNALENEWRTIVRTKSTLLNYCEKPYLSTDDYLAAYSSISEAIDTMRIIYRNSGETDEFIGYYPYAPLHDMRRAIQALDPRQAGDVSQDQRLLVRRAIDQAFGALRETFLEELDLEEPDHPLLVSGARRKKLPGAAVPAQIRHDLQVIRRNRDPDLEDEVQTMLDNQRAKEPGGPTASNEA